ncbi:uncharacterized protein CANTADRAFT_218129 [Suhomyces tanzawaensis NRRL Y-17324]|uniref:Phosphatidylinositol N-acetylglucosaminyltransferase subunit H conserved domain-containing protein n=1 Tax=Suhomyces tanzawaensis NRRL Y-17324 TaxID=984487 RepID=A0A1E4SK49_9ASCO|nr:uncharacterized protein CANTADRAFT_218129 [Suhomyces tanzawaensis NRRL Y-17324]ODV79874.1 hypothetical protein CANTADRAFT_218129 [Suhomyces tanzawaensis NRRL Y-17324]
MSSPKNYALEITPHVDDSTVHHSNLIKFTVKNHTDFWARLTPPYLVLAVSYLIWQCWRTQRVWDGQWWASGALFSESPTHYIGPLVVVIVGILVVMRQTPEDSVIVMKDIGVQLVSKKSWRFQNNVEVFVPLKDIIDLVIHEAFHNYGQVIFYLCVLTKPSQTDSTKSENIIKVVFPEFLPRKDILLQVWKLSRGLLFGETKRYFRRVPGQGLKEI